MAKKRVFIRLLYSCGRASDAHCGGAFVDAHCDVACGAARTDRVNDPQAHMLKTLLAFFEHRLDFYLHVRVLDGSKIR